MIASIPILLKYNCMIIFCIKYTNTLLYFNYTAND